MPTYYINNVSLPEPTQVKWIYPVVKGIDGSGMKRYAPYHSFEMTWNLMDTNNFGELMRAWRGHYGSGTASVTVPDVNVTPDWDNGFVTYTGVFVDRPEYGNYDNKYHEGVKLLVRRVFVP